MREGFESKSFPETLKEAVFNPVSHVDKFGRVIARDFLVTYKGKKYVLEVGDKEYINDLRSLGGEYEEMAHEQVFPVKDASDIEKLKDELTSKSFAFLSPYLVPQDVQDEHVS